MSELVGCLCGLIGTLLLGLYGVPARPQRDSRIRAIMMPPKDPNPRLLSTDRAKDVAGRIGVVLIGVSYALELWRLLS